MDYEAKTRGKLDEIAHTVARLEDTIDKYQITDNHIMGLIEQKKALYEIQSILRKTDDIQEYHREAAEDTVEQFGFYVDQQADDYKGLGLQENSGDRTLDRINTELMHLDDTLDRMNDADLKANSYAEQKRALREIKKALQEAGHYNDSGVAGPVS